MSKTGQRTTPKYKRWIINILILIVATIVMIALSEMAFRWLDGYQMSTIELNQNPDAVQPAE